MISSNFQNAMGIGGKRKGNKMTRRMEPGEGNKIKAGHGTSYHRGIGILGPMGCQGFSVENLKL